MRVSPEIRPLWSEDCVCGSYWLDLRGREGFVSKDTVAGGYGSRLRPFSKTTELVSLVKRRTHDVPSVQLAYLAAIAARHGHDVHWTRDEYADGDVAIVLSSLVDYKQETAWARGMRDRGVRVGFVGLAASKMPQPVRGARRLRHSRRTRGRVRRPGERRRACFRVVKSRPGRIVRRLDQVVAAYQSRGETALMSRTVTC